MDLVADRSECRSDKLLVGKRPVYLGCFAERHPEVGGADEGNNVGDLLVLLLGGVVAPIARSSGSSRR